MAIVKEMDEIFTDGLHGDFIPHSWYTELQFEKTNKRGEGRANLPAVIILADICYWWRPNKVNGDGLHTGRTEKKFAKDRLQRSYRQYAKKGLTKKQAADAVSYLESKSLIEVELRDELINGTYYKNRKYITPIPEAIRAITYNPQDKEEEANDDDIVPGSGVSPGSDTLSPGSDTLSPGSETYTKNTTKITTETTTEKEDANNNTKPCKSETLSLSNDYVNQLDCSVNGNKDFLKTEESLQTDSSLQESQGTPPAPAVVMSSREDLIRELSELPGWDTYVEFYAACGWTRELLSLKQRKQVYAAAHQLWKSGFRQSNVFIGFSEWWKHIHWIGREKGELPNNPQTVLENWEIYRLYLDSESGRHYIDDRMNPDSNYDDLYIDSFLGKYDVFSVSSHIEQLEKSYSLEDLVESLEYRRGLDKYFAGKTHKYPDDDGESNKYEEYLNDKKHRAYIEKMERTNWGRAVSTISET